MLDEFRSPLVTVVVPAYNAERFLDRTLRSALAQTHRELEVLVIDDGSTDRTRQVAEGWTAVDGRVRVIPTPNRGVACARNTGIDAARGEYVAFLDADDLWHPMKIELQLAELLRQGPGWAACYALCRYIDEEDQVLNSSKALAPNGYIYARHLTCRFIGNGSTLLVRRAAAEGVGGFDPSYAARGIGGCEDFDFELKLASRYPVASVFRYLVGYRWHEGSMSSDRRRMARALQATVLERLRQGPDLPAAARNQAKATAALYAFSAYAAARKPLPAGLALLETMGRDPESGWRVLSRGISKVGRRLFGRFGNGGTPEVPRLPRFDEVPAEQDLDRDPPPHIARRAARFREVDVVIWRNL